MTAGRLCIRYDLRSHPTGPDHRVLYRAMLGQVAWADRAIGPDAFVVSEHHGSPDGYCPAPLEVAAAIAAATRLGQIQISAIIAPLHDPVRLAASAAVVDLISAGRLEMVLVGGYRPSEYELLDRSWSDRGEVVEETARILRDAWAGEVIASRGNHPVTPNPIGTESPKIFFGGATKTAARRAAALGDGFVPGGGRVDLIDVYRDECARVDRSPGFVGGGIAPLAVHVSTDVEASWTELEPYFVHDAWMYGCYAAEGAGAPEPPKPSIDEVRERGAYRVVTPEQAIQLWHELDDTAMYFLHPLVGGSPPSVGRSSLELFATEVLPHLDRSGPSGLTSPDHGLPGRGVDSVLN